MNESPPDEVVTRGARAHAWLLLLGLPVGVAGSLVLYLGLRNLTAPGWLTALGAIAFFPILPSVWHVLAERARGAPTGVGRPLGRFALRTLAVGLVVLSVSLATRGPRELVAEVGRVLRRGSVASGVAVSPANRPGGPAQPSPLKPRARHELESFIPADAKMVVALSDPASLRRLFGVVGDDTKKKLSALDTCHISFERARVLIASRDRKTRMIVVRSPGVTDRRNLYCLVGFLGSDKLNLRFSGDKGPIRFEVDGLLPKALKFDVVDEQTIVASDSTWKDTVGQRLFTSPPTQPVVQPPSAARLKAALDRIDRGAGLWAVRVMDSNAGSWDLALEGKGDGQDFVLHASSLPPSGAADKADAEFHVPLKFSSALPAGTIDDLVRVVLAISVAAGSTPDPVTASTAAPPPAAGDQDEAKAALQQAPR